MNTSSADIRGVLINLGAGRLLLPNATVAEVISFSPPEPISNAPDWLLGGMRWRGWRVPVLSVARLYGWPRQDSALGAKVAVLKALGGNPRLPYFAVVAQGFPRLVTVSEERLLEDAEGDALSDGIQARVVLGEDRAVVPDLLRVEALIAEALQAAA
jgi:chemosensory pili system protein ChpC